MTILSPRNPRKETKATARLRRQREQESERARAFERAHATLSLASEASVQNAFAFFQISFWRKEICKTPVAGIRSHLGNLALRALVRVWIMGASRDKLNQ